MNCEQKFRDWLTKYPHHTYKAGTINGYINALKNAAEWFDVQLEVPLLEIETVDAFKTATKTITSRADYADINKMHRHGAFSAAIAAYEKFLTELNENGSEDSIWWPSLSEYNPGITKDQWLELLRDGSTFTDNAYFAIAAMYDIGGEATCRQLADRYGQKLQTSSTFLHR